MATLSWRWAVVNIAWEAMNSLKFMELLEFMIDLDNEFEIF